MFAYNDHERCLIKIRRFRLHFLQCVLILLMTVVIYGCKAQYPDYQSYYPPRASEDANRQGGDAHSPSPMEATNPRAGSSAAHKVMDMRTYRNALPGAHQKIEQPNNPAMSKASPVQRPPVRENPIAVKRPDVSPARNVSNNQSAGNQLMKGFTYIYDPNNPYANKDGFVRIVAGTNYSPYVKKPAENLNKQPGNPVAESYPDRPMVTSVSTQGASNLRNNQINTERPVNETLSSGMANFPAPNMNSHGNVGKVDTVRVANSIKSGVGSLPDVMVVPDQRPSHTTYTEPVVAQSNALASPMEGSTLPSLDGAIKYLEKLIEANPGDVDSGMALRLLYSAYRDNKNAFREDKLPVGQDRGEMSSLAQAVVRSSMYWRDKTNPLYANPALAALDRLSEQISKNADMIITNVKLCSSISGFGNYQEIPKDQLEYHQGKVVWVYCELKNFKHKMNTEGKYYTHLHATIALRDSNYSDLITPLDDDVKDAPIFNKRQDFFLRGSIKLPKLAPGKYEILVSMEDKVVNKKAMQVHYEFDVKGTAGKASSNK